VKTRIFRESHMPRSRWFVNDVRFLFLALGFMILTGCSQQPTPIVLVQTTIPPKTVEIATAIPTRSVIPSATPRPMVQPVAATMPPATTGPTCDEALAGLFQSASSLCLGRPYGLICNLSPFLRMARWVWPGFDCLIRFSSAVY
jgi:hypothetical protein